MRSLVQLNRNICFNYPFPFVRTGRRQCRRGCRHNSGSIRSSSTSVKSVDDNDTDKGDDVRDDTGSDKMMKRDAEVPVAIATMRTGRRAPSAKRNYDQIIVRHVNIVICRRSNAIQRELRMNTLASKNNISNEIKLQCMHNAAHRACHMAENHETHFNVRCRTPPN